MCRPCVGAKRRVADASGEALVQYPADLRLNRAFQRAQQEAQLGGDVHVARLQRDVAIHPAAGEMQQVAVPMVVHAETLVQFRGHFLHDGAGLGLRQLVGVIDGNVRMAVEGLCPQAQVVAVALEVGTRPEQQVVMALLADNWLHQRGDPLSSQGARIRAQVQDAFCPDDVLWRQQAHGRAMQIWQQALAAHGLRLQWLQPTPPRGTLAGHGEVVSHVAAWRALGRFDARGVSFDNALKLTAHYLEGFAWTAKNTNKSKNASR